MNIVRKDLDQNNAVVTVNIVKADYSDKVEKTLRDYRKKANIPGFRPGNVPLSLVQKMYGKAVLAEEINKLVGESLYNFIEENNISVLGEPLPTENQQEIDFNTQEDFDFSFDLGIASEFTVELSNKDKVPFYEITISEEMIDNQVKSYTGRFGKYEQVDTAEPKDMLKGELLELKDGKVLEEGGIKVEDAVLTPEYIVDEEQKALFNNAKKGDVIVFNPKKAYGSEAEISSLLKISKEDAKEIDADFQYTIHGITRYQDAEINQELFDKVYGEGNVTNEADFRAKIKENIEKSLIADSEYKLGVDVRDMLVKKYEALPFPDAFLKRWLLTQNENMTEETLNGEYPKMIQDLIWQLVKNKITKDNDIKVELTDVEAEARKIGRAQFAQYGMYDIDDAIIDNYTKDMLKKEDYVRNVANRVVEDKVVNVVKSSVKLENKTISIEDFNKMFEPVV